MVRADTTAAPRDDGLALRRSEFGRQVRDALRHLYDVPYLHSHPLAQRLLAQPGVRAGALGQMLQRRLVEAIEEVRPREGSPGSEGAERRYVLLKLRYVEAQDLPEILERLGISQSQFYRELDPGLEAIVARLMEELPEAARGPGRPHARATAAEKAPSAALAGASSRFRAPLVGREAELAQLRAAYEAVAAGEGGRLFLVAGESGVGKTRLVQEAGLYVRAQGGLFLEGRYLWGANAPYGPWVEALRPGLRTLPRQELVASLGPYAAEISRVFPELAELFGPPVESSSLGEEEQRLRLYDGVTEVLRSLSQRTPTLLLLDDLHWAPQMTLLVHLVRRLDGCRALLVGAYREQDFSEQPALVRARAELQRGRLFAPMTLERLSEDDTARLLANAFDDDVAARLREAVYSRTRGNPFFVEEALRSLAERGVVRPADAGWEVAEPSLVALPESAKLAVTERVARLGERTAEVLAQAAVLGQEFSLPALARTTDLPDEELAKEIERAVSAGLLVDRSVVAQERYGFRDEQVQEVLYGSIFAPRRQRYHRRAGRAIESLAAADLEPHLEALAHHFSQGHEPEKAAHYSFLAGQKARRLFVWARCLEHYRTALELYEELGGHVEERAAACEGLGDVSYKSAIEAPRGVGYFEQALALYEQLGNRHRVATIHSQLGREHISSANLAVRDQEKALEHFHLACRILEAEGEGIPLGLVYCGLALAHLNLLQWPETVSWARSALWVGERLGSPAVVANACAPLGLALARMGEVAQGVATLERGWQIAGEHGLGFLADLNRACGASVCGLFLKDPRAGQAWVARGRDYRTFFSLLEIPSHLVALAALQGDFAAGVRVLADLQKGLEAVSQPAFGFWPCEPGLFRLYRGEWEEARRLLHDGLEWARHCHDYRVAAPAAQLLGRVHAELGDYARAGEHLGWALDLFRRATDVLGELSLLPALCEVSLRAGERGRAGECLAQAQRILARPPDWGGLRADVYLAEGLVEAADGRWKAAEEAFGRAASACQQYGLPWDEARVCYEWARATLGDVDEGARREQAAGLLRRALALWEPMGAAPYAARCRALLATAG